MPSHKTEERYFSVPFNTVMVTQKKRYTNFVHTAIGVVMSDKMPVERNNNKQDLWA